MLIPFKFLIHELEDMKDVWIRDVIPSAYLTDPKVAWDDVKKASTLTPATKIENFLLLTTGSRKSAMFYPHTIDEIVEAESIAKKVGLGFKTKPYFIRDGSGRFHVTMRGFTFNNKEAALEIDASNSSEMPVSECDYLNRILPTQHLNIGKINGYPSCCTKAYLEDMLLFIDPDIRLTEQVRSYSSKNKPVNIDAFCIEEFLPCRPDCNNASILGRRCEEDLRSMVDESVAGIYHGLKIEHLHDVENETISHRKERGKLSYSPGSFDL
jgi:hypothetical protein